MIGWFSDSRPVVLFGAGNTGVDIARKLRGTQITPIAFADDTPAKQGTSIEGIPVLHVADTAALHGSDTVFIVAIWNPSARFADLRRRLRDLGVQKIASFLHVAYAFPDRFLPHYAFDVPATISRHEDEIAAALALFEDERSRDEFARHLEFRLTLDFDHLPAESSEKYFRREFGALRPDTTFVDCGAFNGDTLSSFLTVTGGNFARAVAIEPHPENFGMLERFVSGLPSAMRDRIELINAAVSDRKGTASFHLQSGQGSRMSDGGCERVATVAIDDVIGDADPSPFIKFDIEGAEQTALRGSTRTLERQDAVLAVSVYHCADDLWRIPLTLSQRVPNHRLFLRTEGNDGAGIVCYAIP